MVKKEKYFQSIMTQIQEKTNISKEDVDIQIDETMDLYGFEDRLTALLLITGEIEKKENVKIYLNKEIMEKEVKNMEKEEKEFEVEKLEDITHTLSDLAGSQDSEQGLAIVPTHQITRYPSEDEIRFLINRHQFVKESLLDENDIVVNKKTGARFVKKSGWRKFINAFGITIKLIEKKVYEQFGDKHAEVRVRAIAPNGQSVEGVGIKSWSELFEKTMHNLQANAWTRAVNRAVSDLVGYGATSAEEEVITDGK